LVKLVLALLLAAAAPSPPAPFQSSYDAEIARLDGEIAAAAAVPVNLESATKHAFFSYRKATLTGEYADFQAAEKAIEAAIAAVGPSEDLLFLEASFHFKVHRLAPARETLARMGDRAGKPRMRAFAADLAYQEGRYAEAGEGYRAALRRARTWDNLARLAFFESRTGNLAAAEKLYLEAQDELTVKEMRSWAWVELQRGLLDLDFGRPAKALEHYRRAEEGYSGWWLIEEHIAEALGQLGRRQEAIELYRRILEKNRSPEFLSALAALLEESDPAAAAELDREALASFEKQSARYPEAALGHYLEHRLDRGAADQGLLEMARRNVALRPGGEARLLLARAYAKMGESELAKEELEAIEATPWRMPELKQLRAELRRSRQPAPKAAK
jgi:tetratricopeptide (TPR) repeat protein